MDVMDGLNRSLTKGERDILFSVFANRLDYSDQEVGVNLLRVGGETNSITPTDTPYFAPTIWTKDFSAAKDDRDKWVFVHEFGHVWQYAIGMNKAMHMVAIHAEVLRQCDDVGEGVAEMGDQVIHPGGVGPAALT